MVLGVTPRNVIDSSQKRRWRSKNVFKSVILGQRPGVTESLFSGIGTVIYRYLKRLVAGETGLEPATLGFGAPQRLKLRAILAL